MLLRPGWRRASRARGAAKPCWARWSNGLLSVRVSRRALQSRKSLRKRRHSCLRSRGCGEGEMSVAKFRIRLLPALMGAMALLLTVKIGGVLQELSVTVGSETEAQTQPQPAPAAQQTPAAPATQTAQQPAAQQPAAPTPAAGTQQPAAQQPAPANGTAAPAAPKPDSEAAIDPFNYTDEEVDVLQQLSKRRAELDAKARQLDE